MMLESGVVYSDLVNREVELTDNLTTEQLTQFLVDAKSQLESIIKNRGLKLRNLCKHLDLTDATKSDEDLIERLRLVVSVSGLTDGQSCTFVFQGTDDDSSEIYYTIATIDPLSFNKDQTISTRFSDSYRFYKLTKTGDGIVSAYLVEASFELAHVYLAMTFAYKSLQSLNGDVWESKAKEYEQKFIETVSEMNYSYDEDESGDVSDDEVKVHQVTWSRK